MTRDIAGALTAAAAEGVHHLVLDPRDVLLTDHGVVLVGVGVRAALAGVTPEGDPYQVDAWRLGAILYAALTARWPGEACAGLPAAPMVAGQLPRPRQVRAGVPVDLDDIAWRALHPSVAHPLATPQAVAEALDKLDAPPDLAVAGTCAAPAVARGWHRVGLHAGARGCRARWLAGMARPEQSHSFRHISDQEPGCERHSDDQPLDCSGR